MSQPLLILIIVGLYLLAWLVISHISSKGADTATFFSGNRKMRWPLVALAMIGAPITGVTLISVPGMVAVKGYSYLQMCLGFIVGYLAIALILVPIYYRLNIVSVYGFLEKRFGNISRTTGSWLFFVSKIIGISIRFLMVCAMLQLLVFDSLGIPYIFCVLLSLTLVWFTTYRGGVKSVIWGDALKSCILILTIALCLFFILKNLGHSFFDIKENIATHEGWRIFYFDNPLEGRFFWKQFIAGVFIVIAMTGLDQDMMQRTLSCKNASDARKNLIVSSVMQVVVISFLLFLGTMLIIFAEIKGLEIPAKTDNLFAMVAFHEDIPIIVGALFVLGVISATYSSVGSAVTSMTTTVTVDMLEADKKDTPHLLAKKRKMIHALICVIMAMLVIFLYYLNQEDAISTVYTVISYTDGPILGLFLFGILTKRAVNEKWIPAVCIVAPILSWLLQWSALKMFDYSISYELLIFNALFTMAGLRLISVPQFMPKASY